MATQPMTPAGVQAKQTELYALSDPDLKTQADTIHSDFRTWMKDNFNLSASQEDYLDSLPEDFVHPVACNTSSAVAFRLPITLVVLGTVSASKLIRTNPALEYTFDPDPTGAGFTVTGSLEINFVYAP